MNIKLNLKLFQLYFFVDVTRRWPSKIAWENNKDKKHLPQVVQALICG